MRELQYFGLFVSAIIALYGLWKFKRRVYNRNLFLITIVIAAGLFIISLFPSAGDLIATPLRMERWNGVIFLSLLILLVLFFYVLNQANTSKRTISKLIQSLAYIRFKEEFPEIIKSDILVIIPAYNEAENISTVLKEIPQKLQGLIISTLVVVDGSTDNTEQVVRELGVPVVINPINRGGGAALRVGYQVALQSGARIVVTLDADGQHVPSEIDRLITPIINDEADFVNGSRVLGTFEKESAIRSLGVLIFNWLISFLMFQKITDSSNAFRAIRINVLQEISLFQDQFHTSEILIDSIKRGVRVKEVPITIRRRQSGMTKKPRSLRYGWGFIKAIFGTWLR